MLMFYWVAVWYFVFFVPNLLKTKFKITYTKNPVIFMVWFWSFLLFFNFLVFYYRGIYFNFPVLVWLLFLVVLCCLFFIKSSTFAHALKKIPKNEAYNDSLSKISEIFLQQFLMFTLLNIFIYYEYSVAQISFLVPIFFVLVHLPLLLIIAKRFAVFLVIASFFAGIIFPFLYLNFKYGFLISIFVHISFYVFLDLIYKKFLKKETDKHGHAFML